MAPDEWQRVLSVNLAGAFHTIRLLAPAVREARFGAISQHVVGCWQNIFGSRGPALRRVKGPLIGLTKHAAAEL
jgi:NAD(P)-dependent dehydrogenase (short-subunit alcohol dehydrogenase family)